MANPTPRVVKAIRKIRHWKQRWDPKARVVWRRETSWPKLTKEGRHAGTVKFPAGSIVPDWVVTQMGGAKLRRFWESNRIELLEFEAPNVATGKPEEDIVMATLPSDSKHHRTADAPRGGHRRSKPAPAPDPETAPPPAPDTGPAPEPDPPAEPVPDPRSKPEPGRRSRRSKRNA